MIVHGQKKKNKQEHKQEQDIYKLIEKIIKKRVAKLKIEEENIEYVVNFRNDWFGIFKKTLSQETGMKVYIFEEDSLETLFENRQIGGIITIKKEEANDGI